MVPLALLLLAAVATAEWVGRGSPLWLSVAAVAAVGGILLLRTTGRSASPWAAGASSLLVAALVLGFAAEWHLSSVSRNWDARMETWERTTQVRLAEALDRLLLANEDAADRLARELAGAPFPPDPVLPGELPAQGVDALAVFGPGGELLAWNGSHQGPVPREVRLGLSPYAYGEGALFGYLYISRSLEANRGTVVAASLLRADLPETLEDVRGDFVSRFGEETGASIQLARADRVEGESVWDLRWEDQVLFSVTLLSPSEAESRLLLEARWGRGVALLLLLTWLLLVPAFREERGGRTLLAGGLFLLVFLLPAGPLLGLSRLFSPADFLLPGPLSITTGDLLLLGGVILLISGFLVRRQNGAPRTELPGSVPPAAAALVLVLLLGWVGRGASVDLLAGPEPFWLVLVAGVGLAGVALVGNVFHLLPPERSPPGATPRHLFLAVVLAALLGGAAALWMRRDPGLPWWAAAAWFAPLLLLSRARRSDARWRDGAVLWGSLALVVFSLVLPWGWGERIQARMAMAEERMERLGTRADPFMEFLLLRTGEQADDLSATGRNPVELLYSAWTEGGLAAEGVPVWLTWWSPEGLPQEELRIGVGAGRPTIPASILQAARVRSTVVLERMDQAEAHYMMAAPLARGALLTAVVPPRRGLGADSPLGPLFSPARAEPDPLVLIPLAEGEVQEMASSTGVRWIPSPEGWKGETFVLYPDEVYHGHYRLALPAPLLLGARGTLVGLGALLLVLLLWSAGRRLALGVGGGPGRADAALLSFRGKITVALFFFFLIPSLLFGTLAYRTLAGASIRTAEALAARAVEDASAWYSDVAEAMDLLATRVGSDLLLYEGGQLVAGSLRELVELGLYEGWLPPEVHREMARGEELMATATATLGGYEYVVAYRRMPGGRVLAAPAPLQAGATALRQREVAELLAFALVLGGGLSVLLALLVGRTLARPIQTLQVASERVGAGNMGVHLPTDRTDEFGAVFGAFNRMVDRLARTRKALVRSSRRTRAIVEEVATGVVALDAQGRVTLANPRAEQLLGTSLSLNRPLPREGRHADDGPERETREGPEGETPDAPGATLARWAEQYMRDGPAEAGTEFQFGDRRIRVRARRISRRGPPGGTVLSLEDVTDELRTERILAWGEMAKQVAHEVKNPLTPIKLGVQHIRRAWEDGREDFETILSRNVEAILREIERLAATASSFSRYSAPSPAGEKALEAVDVEMVVEEVLALYSAGEGPVSFGARIPENLPPVRARSGELKEVLVNLLENARTALPGGGCVRIEAEEMPGGVELRVRDDGSGIPEEVLSRVFEPYFSTRTGGSGLGLSIVRRLVESWDGRISVESQAGEGTLVRMEVEGWTGEGSGGDASPEVG